ncbi:MAG TPA: ABC transporter substrate-binding protein [Polyangiales bacterium]|jgi:branched-chain amino acid transport system substrate-binding protein|nr:ABC transporter substrate-binding protein [Polyangiales bacterium]
MAKTRVQTRVKPARARFSLGLLAVLLSLAGSACKNDANEIVIGEFGSLTGGTATFGTSTHAGIEQARDELNAGGGVLGKKLKVVTEDDQSKPEEAVSAVLKLIKQNNVVAVIGEVASSRSLAAAPQCQQNKIPMLSPASTNPKVTEVGDYIFRACFIDPFQGSTMAKFAMSTLKLKKFAILTDAKNDYSVGLSQFFREMVKKQGGEIVAEESYAEGDIEFKAQLTKIKNTSPEAVFVPGYYTECALIARQAKELGLTVPLLGGDGWDSPKTIEIGGAAVEGVYFTNHYSEQEQRPEVKKFIDTYKQRNGGKTPDAMAVLGYDSMMIMADAIKRAGSTEGPKIRDALAATKGFSGVSGKISIDDKRNAQKSIVVLKIEGGKFNFVESVAP